MSALHEAVAESIVRDGRDELAGLSSSERTDAVNGILNQVSQKSDDELISFISSKGSDVSPELKEQISEIQDVRARIGSPEGGEMAHIEALRQKKADIQKIGIVTDRPLPAGSIEIGFSDSPAKAVKDALSEHFGADTPVFSRGKDLLYLDPKTKEVVRVEPDMIQSLGLSLPIGGDIAGTIGGGAVGAALTKSPAGIVAGEATGSAIGASTGEYLRLLTGKFMGAHDLPHTDILKKAGWTGVKAGAATGAIGSLVVSAKGLNNFFKGNVFTKKEALKHGMNSKEAELVLEEVNKILGKKGAVKGTLGRMTDDVLVQSKEAEVRRLGEHAQKFVDRDLADQKFLTEAMDVVTKPKTAEGGQAIIDVATKQVGKRTAQAKGIVSENVTQLEKQMSNIGKVSHELIGQPTRKIILAKSDAAKKAQAKVWTDLKKAHGFKEETKSFDITIPRGEGAKKLAAISARRAETAQIAGVKSAETKGLVPKAKMADLEDYNHNLKLLRADIRAASASRKAGDATVAGMKEIEQTLIADRKLALIKAGKGGLLKDIEAAEKATADYYKTYRRSVIGDLTKKTDDVFTIKSKDFVDKMLKSTDEEAKQLLQVIGDKPTLVAMWKEGIADSYKRAAFKGNKFNRDASTKFLRKNADVLEQFFSKGELKSLETAGSLAEKVAKQSDQLKRIVSAANSKFGKGKLKSLDPENLVKFVTNNSGSFAKPSGQGVQASISKIKYVKGITKNHPAAWQSFKDEFSTQLRKSSFDIKTNRISPANFNKMVNEQEKEIIEIMGKGYFNDLVKINKAVQVLNKKEVGLIANETKQGVLAVARALVAPPLTRRGRALTAGNIFLSKESHRVIADSLLNPSKIHKIAELASHSRITREAAELAVSTGMIGEEDGN